MRLWSSGCVRTHLKTNRNPKIRGIQRKKGADEGGVADYSDRGQALFNGIPRIDDAKQLQINIAVVGFEMSSRQPNSLIKG